MSMRRAVARPTGAGDLMDAVVAYEQSEGLTESQRVALRLHDAFLIHPGRLDAVVQAETLEHFSPAQIVELAFKFMYWSSNRPVVTLGIDAPHDRNRLTSFHYTEKGEYVVHHAQD
ncbi:MAG TPA: hypothetical protein VH702_11995 [Vicinamibacterales bacterium]|jgi:hypothetical protein